MGALTYLTYEATCPVCAGTHRLRVQTGIAQWDGFGAHDLRVGDPFTMVELSRHGYRAAAAPSADGAIRLIEDGLRCGEVDLWTEVTVLNGAVADLRLTVFDLAALARVQYLCDGGCLFSGWVSNLPDPSEWNDGLSTDDRLENLRLKLMLREPLPARNRHEVELFVAAMAVTPKGPLAVEERDGRRVWVWPCKRGDNFGNEVMRLQFLIADEAVSATGVATYADGPSSMVPADRFRRSADELAARVPVYTADLIGDAAGLLDDARRDLGQAIADLEQVLALIPAGEDAVPERAFWGEGGREAAQAAPDRYRRGRIEATLTRWKDDLARLGVRPTPVVRSAEEAHVYMAVAPCPRCGTATPQLASKVEARGAALVSVYAGPCSSCALPRRFELELDERLPEGSGDDVSLGTGRSACLDPGQLLLAADQLVRGVPGERSKLDARNTYALQLAVAVIDQVLAFVPPGAGAVAERDITSRAGWAVYEREPGRFGAARLQAVRGAYRELLGIPRLRAVD